MPTAVLGGAFLLAFLPSTHRAPAGETTPATVRIGLLSTLFRDAPEPVIQVMARPFKSLMEDQAGFVGQVVVDNDAGHMALDLKDDKLQLGVFNGFEFAWARVKNPALKPLIICVNQQPFARSVLVVRKDSKAANFADLQGKILSLPRLGREYSRMYVERRCSRPGLPMEKWFDKVASPITANDAMDDVAQDIAQVTVVDDIEFTAFQKAYPKTAAQLRVLAESEAFPCAVIAYHPGGMKEDTLTRLYNGLVAAKTNPRGRKLLDLCRITGFEAVPANYEQNLADILKAYPPSVK
jgi:ABC-type phosphate/phosphonate transport system substrate-binding protein